MIKIKVPTDAKEIAKMLKSKPRGGLWAEAQKNRVIESLRKEKGGK